MTAAALLATRYSLFALPDHVGQQSEEARTLDGLRQLALLLGGDRGDAARHDLAALGDVALQQPHVLVVDLRRIGAGEWTGLAAAKEWPAGLRLRRSRKCHGHYSSIGATGGDSSALSRGGRLSRSRRCSPRSRSRSRKLPRSRSRKPKPRSSRSRSRSTLRIMAEGPSSCSSTRMVM